MATPVLSRATRRNRATRRSSTASPAIRTTAAYGAAGRLRVSESDEKLWATIAHISIPFFGFIGPLIVYLIYKDRGQS